MEMYEKITTSLYYLIPMYIVLVVVACWTVWNFVHLFDED